jgi:hypothetical protein
VAADEIMTLWWIPIGVVIIGGLALAGILAIFLKPVRERFWKPVGRALCWLFTLRLITTHRLKVLSDERESLLYEVFDAHSQGRHQAAEEKQAGIAEGRAEALAEIEAERSVPLVKPNWTVSMMGGGYTLANTQRGVSVSEVSLSAPVDKFTLDGQTQWSGKFSQMTPFKGVPTHAGRKAGVEFTVRYRDARGDWHDLPAFLDRESRQTVWF